MALSRLLKSKKNELKKSSRSNVPFFFAEQQLSGGGGGGEQIAVHMLLIELCRAPIARCLQSQTLFPSLTLTLHRHQAVTHPSHPHACRTRNLVGGGGGGGRIETAEDQQT